MDATETRELLRTLERELDSLATRLRGQAAGVPDPGSTALTEGDRGTDLFDQVQATESLESHYASRDRIVERLQRVTMALERVKDGTHGECLECARPIPMARLRALPEATTCVACQERLERSGRQAARHAAPSPLAETEATPARAGLRPADLGEFRSASEILEDLRESIVPEMPATSPARDDASAARHGRRGAGRARHGRVRGAYATTRSIPAGTGSSR
jgi:DnaK suppressor protein